MKRKSAWASFKNSAAPVFWLMAVSFSVLLVSYAPFWFGSNESDYYAVSLASGEVYFGALHRFPKFYLSDAYLLEAKTDDPNWPYRLTKLADLFGLDDKIYINYQEVKWMSRLESGSGIMNFIASRRQSH